MVWKSPLFRGVVLHKTVVSLKKHIVNSEYVGLKLNIPIHSLFPRFGLYVYFYIYFLYHLNIVCIHVASLKPGILI